MSRNAKAHRSRRGRGRELRSWPLLALLVLTIGVGAGCVLWFMREAARNERLAVRQRLAEAYRGHLALVQTRLGEEWSQRLGQLDGAKPGPAEFSRCVLEGVAESVIFLGGQTPGPYPVDVDAGAESARSTAAASGDDLAARELQAEARALARSGDVAGAIKLITDRFAEPRFDSAIDGQGRIVAANAELFALELMEPSAHSGAREITERLTHRVAEYEHSRMPAAQRRFLMHELQRRSAAVHFPTLAAEDLAARYLNEVSSAPTLPPRLEPTGIADVWRISSPGGRAVALFTTAGLRRSLQETIAQRGALPGGVTVSVLAPGEDDRGGASAALVTAPAGDLFSRWRLALSLDDRTIFQSAADRRVARYFWTGTLVVGAMLGLCALIVHTLGRQVRLATLKNDLVATVSHELKTPLTSMRALVETLLDSPRIEEPVAREYLQLVAQENARLSRMIDSFLTFSRLEQDRFSFDFAAVAPQRVVDGAVAAFVERGRMPGCQFEAQVEPDLPPIRADLDALVTALLNLLDNAWKYGGEKKQIELRVGRVESMVRFAVQDRGIGLPPREARKVFGRFYQVDQRLSRATEGCGLGLSIVDQIVSAHGGVVSIVSTPGGGSTFTMEIPVFAHPPRA